jgi:2-haloacid dehalogenase
MTVLTNGNLETAKAQLAYAEIDHFFGEIFSVESIRIYKPHPATYSHVVKEMKASPIYSMLLSAHAWDLMGAQRTGLMTGFVQRPGKGAYPLMERPTLTGTSLISMAQTLVGA